ncbi:MAG: universal stress protein [Streptococcaceae bacterium]|nr:universal stress protein [Streptococcaceae bacterium]
MKDIYKRILVAIDESTQALNALFEAVSISKRNNAKLFILYVADETRLRGTSIALTMSLGEIEAESKSLMEDVTSGIRKDISFESVASIGNPKKEIVRFAKDNEIDLIVIGSNSKNFVTRTLIGSTTSYVVEKAPCNVMIVK